MEGLWWFIGIACAIALIVMVFWSRSRLSGTGLLRADALRDDPLGCLHGAEAQAGESARHATREGELATYQFVLKFRVSDDAVDSAQCATSLAESGCTDALFCVGQLGIIELEFTREATCAHDAVCSALADVRKAIPGAQLVEAVPDIVGLTEVADFLGWSRQYMRKFAHRDVRSFPSPIHVGKPSVWHLSSVLCWVESNRKQPIDANLAELAKLTMSVNIAVGEREADPMMVDAMRSLIV